MKESMCGISNVYFILIWKVLIGHTFAGPCSITHDTDGVTADCISRNLTSVPHGLPWNITIFRLRDNQIRGIQGTQWRNYPHIRHLDLSVNQIITTKKGTFSFLQNLEVLDLRNNDVTDFDPETFQDLVSLKVLKLFHFCQYAPSSSFDGMPNLHTLYITVVCGATPYPVQPLPDGYSQLTSLRHLDISYNIISEGVASINSSLLDSLRLLQLETLGLHSLHALRSIAPGTFDNLPHLTTINLANNGKLGVTSAVRAFEGLQGTPLTSLVLDKVTKSDKPEILTGETYFGDYIMNNIERLTLRCNTIPIMSVNTFKRFRKLRILSLAFISTFYASDSEDLLVERKQWLNTDTGRERFKNFQLSIDKIMPNSLEILDISHGFDSREVYNQLFKNCYASQANSRVFYPACDIGIEDFFPNLDFVTSQLSQLNHDSYIQEHNYTQSGNDSMPTFHVSDIIEQTIRDHRSPRVEVNMTELMLANKRLIRLPTNLKYITADHTRLLREFIPKERHYYIIAESLVGISLSGTVKANQIFGKYAHTTIEGLDTPDGSRSQ